MKKLTLLFICIFPFFSFCQNYQHDNFFGTNGRVVTDINNGSEDVSVSFVELNDHSIITLVQDTYPSNTYYLIKYLPSGTIDTNYGNNGFINLSFIDVKYFSKMILKNNDRILLIGKTGTYPNYNTKITQLLSNGNLDVSFANNGSLETIGILNFKLNSNNTFFLYKIVKENNINQLEQTRFLENGSLDISFGTNGFFSFSITNSGNNLINQVQFINNKRYIYYKHLNTQSNYEYYIAVYYDNGSIDTTFGINGELVYYSNASTQQNITKYIKTNGSLIFAIKDQNSFYLKQYTSNGQLDNSFSTNGIATNNLDYSNEMYGHYVNSIICKNNNDFFVIGAIGGEEETYLTIHKFNNNGNLEDDFSINFGYSYQHNQIKYSDDKFIILGETFWYSLNQNIVLERYSTDVLDTKNYTQAFKIYPNPVHSNLIIDNTTGNVNYTIFNILGKKILTGKFNSLSKNIDVSNIHNGIYLIKINDKSYKFIKK